MEPTTNESGRNKLSPPVRDFPVEKKLKTSSVACKGPPTAKKLLINLPSFEGKKEVAESKPVTLDAPKLARTIADNISHVEVLSWPQYLGLPSLPLDNLLSFMHC